MCRGLGECSLRDTLVIRPLSRGSACASGRAGTTPLGSQAVNALWNIYNLQSMRACNFAMVERERRDFHHEFTTLRFRPLSEHGTWEGRRVVPG